MGLEAVIMLYITILIKAKLFNTPPNDDLSDYHNSVVKEFREFAMRFPTNQRNFCDIV
jgi:hypothetical protein